MRIGCLLSARDKATRLPNKARLDLAGAPVTVRLLQRLALAEGVDLVALATSTHPDDASLAQLAAASGVAVFRGSEQDKLRRYRDAARALGLDAVVIVDGDDPLCFPEAVEAVARELRVGGADCVLVAGLPVGAAASGLTLSALERVMELKAEDDTEVWGGYFVGSGRFQVRELRLPDPLLNHPELRLTLDYPEDYALISAVFQAFAGRVDFTSREVMQLLLARPELARLNQAAQARYEAHLRRSAPVRFRGETDPAPGEVAR